ncbi:MAG: o-succinylbenzoate synthase [Nostocaceae cyanobacterium]|nr:o-succinylbenzoate synthase [Nostocaceae cyanobacterium]
MFYQFEFHPYQRQFKIPLQTNHGVWKMREGIIIRLTDNTGKVGWGEIAPLDWFGSESFAEAWDFCCELPAEITQEMIFAIPDTLRACQFGFESALSMVLGDRQQTREEFMNPVLNSLTYSALLPALEAALHSWEELWNQGYRTFKWKIGVAALDEELKIFQQLTGQREETTSLPKGAKLRLDANGGLGWSAAKTWLEACDEAGMVEFLEQPLGVDKFEAMWELSNLYSTPLALDESVANLQQLKNCYELGWRGVFVIKAAIAGSPSRLRRFCQQHQIDAVFSSVFETAIGRQAALNLAAELSHQERAVGFGVNHWFNDDEETWLEKLWSSH